MTDKSILIVDDEESILTVLKSSLKKLVTEYRVVTVANGQAALEQIKQRSFDLVVTDYKMAGLDGLRLLEQIRLERPETRVIFNDSLREFFRGGGGFPVESLPLYRQAA